MHWSGLTDAFLQTSAWLHDQAPFSYGGSQKGHELDWNKIVPNKALQWQPCYADFQCARLEVPKDWLGDSAEANQTVQLALIKVEATVPITDPTYGGAVVLNPGGPGGSGVDQVLRGGHHVRTIVSAGPDADHATARNFDIIGFDPRGVNNTTPFLSCAPNHLEAARQAIEEDAHGFIDSSDTAFDYIWARKRAWADDCSRRAAAQGIGKHLSTAPVARDIIEIFERHGEWREQEVQRQLSRDNSLTEADKEAIIDRTAYHPGEEMVQYWGFSYGSILGATLSAMFPKRIKRAVLDGVSDSHDYMAAGWTTNLRDTDLTFVKLAAVSLGTSKSMD